ncbi:MAG: SDR family oxidoreductase [Pseudomonadota bacterium]
MRLAGKRAFITAAGQGIGRATALAFANEGATVIATDINEALLAELPGDVTPERLDVLDRDALKASIERAAPDILFNCAGVVHSGTILDNSDDEIDFAFDLNVKAAMWGIRAVVPGMVARGGGSIINMSSALSSIIGAPNRTLYGATKAAVVGLTKSVALDFVTKGIRVNCICPGTVDSPSLHERLSATGDYEAAKKAFIARQPMGRIARAEEIALLAVYLGSDESAFVTGQPMVIDGAWSVG